VYSIENELQKEIKLDLSETQKLTNRTIISEYLSQSSILYKLNSILEEAVQISSKKRNEKAESKP
jgi:hypothetical protein